MNYNNEYPESASIKSACMEDIEVRMKREMKTLKIAINAENAVVDLMDMHGTSKGGMETLGQACFVRHRSEMTIKKLEEEHRKKEEADKKHEQEIINRAREIERRHHGAKLTEDMLKKDSNKE